MPKNERVLAIDIGATSIKLCEFEYRADGTMELAVFAYREYEEELSEDTRMGVVAGLLRQMLAECGVRARKALLSMSGQSALIRFGKIKYHSNIDRKHIRQQAEFEARRNIPFASDEVIWDYQLIAGDDSESLDVMSVVIKDEIVNQFTTAVSSVGLDPILVDVAPVCCYNAMCANDLGKEGCVAVLNIGGRSTNLIFIEGERFYARTIPIAGYSITQQIAKEFGIGLPEAEELKRHHGFVALGGAYAEPGSETAAAVSKIIRNVMVRLHGEISRTISIYRASQKGSPPVKMYLTGGSSILTYCDLFFSEKLGIPVEYFNPFAVVSLNETVDRQKLAEVAHMFSETIGLGVRYGVPCPIEISLLPKSIRRQQALTAKKPYFIASMCALLALLAVIMMGSSEKLKVIQANEKRVKTLREQFEPNLTKIERMDGSAKQKLSQYTSLNKQLLERTLWPMIINEIYRLKPDDLWLTSIRPVFGEIKPFEAASFAKTVQRDVSGDPDAMFDANALFDNPEGGGMFGGGLGAPGAAAAGPTEKLVKIGGFTLSGSFITPPGRTTAAITDYPNATFPFAVPEKAQLNSGEDEQATGSAATSESPENVFLTRLRSSALFSNEISMTALKRYKELEMARNGGKFTIQVKLTVPVEYYQY